MTSIILCIVAFVVSYLAARRSLVAGLAVTFSVGYFYGILRANLQQSFAHFIFDAAVIGLYIAFFTQQISPAQRRREKKLKAWAIILVAWPAILLLVPVQDFLVELVGLRGNIFLLPFLLLGVRLTSDEFDRLALWIAALNLVVFGFSLAEFFLGTDWFFPYRDGVTTIIYLSTDVANYTAFRIPSTFTSAHAYAGTMVITLPLLIGAWLQKRQRLWQGYLLAAALVVSIIGVFMAAVRTPTVILILLLVLTTLSRRLKVVTQIGWVIVLLGVVWLVSSDERLQRFMTLRDTEYVSSRIYGSVNEGFGALAIVYPMGNGLGGGGTSLPYFLRDRVKNPVGMENEYVRIMLEQGVPGLCLWAGFLFWVFSRRINSRSSSWDLGRRLAWYACGAYFLIGLTGTGLLTSIPQTCLLLLCTGWISGDQLDAPEGQQVTKPRRAAEGQVLAQQHG